MQFDITTIVEAVAALIAAIITAFVVPCIKSRTTTNQQQQINAWVRIAVTAAEQIYAGSGRGNCAIGEPWPITDAAYKSLINLLVDICQRNGIKRLLWRGDKSLIGQVDKQNMTVHRWFAKKSCPGNWLYEHHGQIAADVNARLGTAGETEDDDMDVERFKELWREMRKELQDNDASAYSEEARKWAVENGIVQGGNSGEFNGMWEDMMTREQFVTVLYRFAKKYGLI